MTANPLTPDEERAIREWCAEHPLLPGSIQMDPDNEPCQERWLATLDVERAGRINDCNVLNQVIDESRAALGAATQGEK
jgi:hypothetical protein